MATTTTTDSSGEYRSKMAFVVGFTGESGKELVRELLTRKVFRKLILIGRREVKLDGELYKDVEQRIVDFDNLDQHKAAFESCTAGFCCLGTTLSKSGKAAQDGLVKIDHDYVVNVAKNARDQGCQHFSVVSSRSADKNSRIHYLKTKGLMEHHVAELGFPRFSIFRPGLIICDREQRTWREKLGIFFMKPIVWTAPTWLSVPAESIARAMVANLQRPKSANVEFYENWQIHDLAKELQ